jgi:hypothetical protein
MYPNPGHDFGLGIGASYPVIWAGVLWLTAPLVIRYKYLLCW